MSSLIVAKDMKNYNNQFSSPFKESSLRGSGLRCDFSNHSPPHRKIRSLMVSNAIFSKAADTNEKN
jgi:hypothetical protein